MTDEFRTPVAAGRAIRNAWLTIGDPGLAEYVASSESVDAVTIDLQHSEIDESRIADLVRAIELGGANPMARLSGPNDAQIGRLLDLGVSGLIMPGVSSPAEAVAFVEWTRHPPRGTRSFGPIRPVTSEADPVLWAMIETKEGLDHASQIAGVDGINGLFIGPGDLGISLGIGGGQNRTEPVFRDAVAAIREAATAAGGGVGIHSTDIGYSRDMIDTGFGLVTVWVDIVVIQTSLRSIAEGLRYRESSGDPAILDHIT